MNDYDSSRIIDLMREQGYKRTAQPEDADLLVVVTCSIREKAQEKTFSDLGRLRELKKEKPSMRIAVGGCVASQEGKHILSRSPWVDVVFGPQTLHRLPELLTERERTGKPQVDIEFPEIEKFDCLPAPTATGATAFVSVMEGCSKYCSYCVVPYTRGEEISRPLMDVLVECAHLASQGVKEITLLGQNVNAYCGRGTDGNPVDFATLLEFVSEIPGIERIRYTTSHPKEFSDRLIEAYGKLPKLANHVHLPVQSGSDRILSAMKRGYTALEYKSIVRRLRAVRPDISIATDIIVGFPGETESEAMETVALVEKVRFDALFTFIFSPRPGTPAAKMEDPVPREEKQRWFDRLCAVQNGISEELHRQYVGQTLRCLVDGESDDARWPLTARTAGGRLVHCTGDRADLGEYRDVKITDSNTWALFGTIE